MTLYLFGSGGGARELLESRESLGMPSVFKKIICVQDNPERDFLFDIPIISIEKFNQIELDDLFDCAFISAADVYFKQRIDKLYPNLRWVSFVHRNSDFLLLHLGFGNWFGYGSHVASDVKVGKHVRINFGAVVPHGCEVGDYSFVGINACVCGGTKIGRGVYVGSGSVIINKDLKIGDFSVIGAGAVVTKDVPDYAVVMGVPAKVVKTIQPTPHEGWQYYM